MGVSKTRPSVVYVDRIEDLPRVEHWAILEDSSVHVPAEGVWAPGHGYPAHNENFIKYTAYLKIEEFEAELVRRIEQNRFPSGRAVIGIHVPGVYTSKVVVKLEEISGNVTPKT